ncbi:2-oxoglutarate oxidoreductase subunit KorA [bacterium BMS3Abin08]|nr:2-oxoglutarate oxidoreductase subunit KorA [bacterium BMS3Abin08]HDZ61635.1 2-oxoacid:acceptor oxidoreductase subunit alpha [Nitrospirota bacterium]
MDYTIRIGGEAGQGLQTIGGVLAKVFSRSGFHVFTHQDYMSRIRGGHNFYQIRFSDKEVMSSREKVDILIALDLNTIETHKAALSEKGIIIYDGAFIKKGFDSPEFSNIPFEAIAVEAGGNRIMANTVATGAVLGMLGMDLTIFEDIIRERFRKKGEEITGKNITSARAGFDHAVKTCTRCDFAVPKPGEPPLMLINGNEATGLGVLMSGCRFYSAYPMTPSTGIMVFLASKAEKYGIVVEQAEDEISAINMALGASFAGTRAMTGSSGGGFALMVEGLSLAAMTETPIVIAEVQRPGPATGLPTRTEQADLLFVLHAGHGEFARVVLAPGTPEQAFYLTNKAFDLAEKYQIPVFILSDQYLADTEWTLNGFDTGRLRHNDYRLRNETLEGIPAYKRHRLTENGISPMAVPGESGHIIVTDSDEHDEEGHMIEDAETRIKMTQKRLLKKLPLIRQEIEPPFLYGSDRPDIVVAGWGSTYGVMKEAVDVLSRDYSIAMLHFSELHPFPSLERFDYLSILGNAKLTLCIENNATGQFSRLMRAETGYRFNAGINKYDGRPFTLEGLSGELYAHIGKL